MLSSGSPSTETISSTPAATPPAPTPCQQPPSTPASRRSVQHLPTESPAKEPSNSSPLLFSPIASPIYRLPPLSPLLLFQPDHPSPRRAQDFKRLEKKIDILTTAVNRLLERLDSNQPSPTDHTSLNRPDKPTQTTDTTTDTTEPNITRLDELFRGAITNVKIESVFVRTFLHFILVKHFFSEGERANRNCTGTRGKQQLDPDRLGKIKEIVLKYYHTEARLNNNEFWKSCISRIDEFLRRKHVS